MPTSVPWFSGALVASSACSPSYFVTRAFFLLTLIIIGALRGFAKRLPRRGGSGRHDKAEQMTEVACFENRYSVAEQTLSQAQGDGSSFKVTAAP
ncbi:MAG TPA: hypothetical protein DCZ76_01700 [Treponema sp.]|nr:hypothetical protein [Treponema sp.]